jgi:predicted transposase/invertase (TIGR01784 family)
MYDSTCKFIASQYSQALATWLLGKPVELTEIDPSELSLEPIRADSVILLESDDTVCHIEFQTDPHGKIPYRMLDYAVRLHRNYPHKKIYQVVIYLTKSNSPLVRQNRYEFGKTSHEFEVIRLWEIPHETFLQTQGLLPFAILSQVENRENLLREIAEKIEDIEDKETQSNLAASTAILAGLVLKKELIKQLLKEEIMKQSVIYQEIKNQGKIEGLLEGEQKGLVKGKKQGRIEGKKEGEVNLILRLLNRRIGTISNRAISKITSLSIEELENLGEAIFEFNSEVDLWCWLEN